MNNFNRELSRRLDALCARGLHRELRRVNSFQGAHIQMGGQTFLNFSSNDYLGFANDPILKEAAVKAVEKFGTGSGASRLVCGSLAPHHELEEALAAFKNTGAALTFSSGYAAAVGTICALLGKDDIIVLDKLVHASVVDAARLCGAKLRVFAHNDLNNLEDILKWANRKDGRREPKTSVPTTSGTRITRPSERKRRTLVVTESIFSMDGDAAPLREIATLKEKYGAWLMVDEAHATGLYGKNRRGLAEELGVSERIEIQMGTLGKALGASGGFICGSRTLIDFLVNHARSFIFSTAPVPAAAAAATAGVRLVQSNKGEKRRKMLWTRVREFQLQIGNTASRVRSHKPAIPSAIVPIMIGDEKKALKIAAALHERGIFVPAIRYPTVARGKARLRVTLTATHTTEEINLLVATLKEIVNRKS